MNNKDLAKIFKALSNENRIALFLEIMKRQSFKTDHNECLISNIIDTLNIGAPTISHHLKELANADLIITERRGKFLVARINDETIKKLEGLFQLKD